MAINLLTPSKGPNLQVPYVEYNQQQQNYFVNQLKLYHTQIDSNAQQLITNALSANVLQWISTGNG
jgi:hypothetical protein